jgi:3,2-trans-enoyl-CoA isomerase
LDSFCDTDDTFSIIYIIICRCKALSGSIKQAEKDRKIQALILTSSKPSIFSAGLELTEMHKPDMKRLVMFWSSFQDLYLDLYGSRLACIAAMQGHAPAAGCMLAMSCDYRIMAATTETHRPTIGLNESKLGIVAPPWLGQQMVDTIGRRNAEISLALGTLYSPEEALKIGLVDLVVPQDQVEAKASEAALQWAKIPAQARVASKRMIRKDRLDRLKASRSQDVEHFANFVITEHVQDSLTAYLDMLAKKGKKK